METLEEKVLKQFKKEMGEEVKGLDLFAEIYGDEWEPEFVMMILEAQTNGRVWQVECTKSGKIKDISEL